jgi:hypothetical protein
MTAAAKRIASFLPSATEIVRAQGIEDRVVVVQKARDPVPDAELRERTPAAPASDRAGCRAHRRIGALDRSANQEGGEGCSRRSGAAFASTCLLRGMA